MWPDEWYIIYRGNMQTRKHEQSINKDTQNKIPFY